MLHRRIAAPLHVNNVAPFHGCTREWSGSWAQPHASPCGKSRPGEMRSTGAPLHVNDVAPLHVNDVAPLHRCMSMMLHPLHVNNVAPLHRCTPEWIGSTVGRTHRRARAGRAGRARSGAPRPSSRGGTRPPRACSCRSTRRATHDACGGTWWCTAAQSARRVCAALGARSHLARKRESASKRESAPKRELA
jgi:hypothetical protein